MHGYVLMQKVAEMGRGSGHSIPGWEPRGVFCNHNMISCAEKRSRQGEAGRGPAPAAPATASLLLWLPWGCSGIPSVPAIAMHSAVSGTLPLVEGFLGLGEG